MHQAETSLEYSLKDIVMGLEHNLSFDESVSILCVINIESRVSGNE